MVRDLCDIIREHFPVPGLNPLAALPSYIGIRETWHAESLHQITEAEILTGERFPDAIANGTYRVDVHYADREGVVFRYLNGREELVATDHAKQYGRWRPETTDSPTFYQIPYRALVTKAAANLLVAGRCLDADEGAFGAVRVMVNCNQTGEAAGVAAYVALNNGASVSRMSTRRSCGPR